MAWGGMQALDWIFLFGIASAMAGWRRPLTVIGNNLSVLRRAYDATGGYEEIPFSVTEDYSLVQSIATATDYKVVFPLNPDTVVRSRACTGINPLFRQKQRWGVGGLDLVWQGILVTSIGWFLRVLLIMNLFSGQFGLTTVATASMLFLDLRFLWKPLKTFDELGYLRYFPVFELYYLIYVPLIPFVAMFS